MGKSVLIVALLLVLAVPAMGQSYGPGGWIAVVSPADTTCALVDGAGLCEYYIFHLAAPDGVTGSQFMINKGHAGTEFPEDVHFAVAVGNTNVGLSVGYGLCLVSPIHIATLTFFCQGTTPACATMEVVGHPTATPPGLLSVDCDSNLLYAAGGISYINDDGSCPCVDPVSTQQSNWGRIKALYSR